MYVEPVRGMSAAQTKQTVQMTTDTDNTIHAQSTEGEAEYTSYDSTTPKTSASQTMTAEEMQGEPAAKENETKAEKFIRIGEYRMNKAVDAIGRLENLANRSFYEYTQEQVDAMFQALEGRVAEVKARFTPKKAAESKTFSFGITE